MHHSLEHHPRGTRLAALAVALMLSAAPLALAQEASGVPGWQPQVSEELVRLPTAALDRRIERDFSQSSLGQAVREQDETLRLKMQTLADISAAIELADADRALELQHKLLLEKQSFIRLAGEKNALQRQQLDTKKRLLERVMSKLNGDDPSMSASRRELVERQAAARERLEASIAMADQLLSTNPLVQESRYATDYEQKRGALDALRARIAEHPMNLEPIIDGEQLSKPDYIRYLIASTEGEAALIDMEDEMLGLMAKLTSLDALALADQVEDPEAVDGDRPVGTSLVQAVEFFMN